MPLFCGSPCQAAIVCNEPNSTPIASHNACCNMVPCIPDSNTCKPPRLCHARNYYNPARDCAYARFSLCEWDQNNKANYCVSTMERNLAERLRTDAWRAVEYTDKVTRQRQCSNTKKLADRVYDLSYWKEQLLHEMNAMDTEMENLCDHKRITEKALYDSHTPLNVAEECMMQREKRSGIDQVHDEAERQLCREVTLIRKWQDRLEKLIQKAVVQTKMNRCARHALDVDVRDKHHAQNLDDRMEGLRSCSFGIGYHPGIETFDNSTSNPASWAKYSQENIARSREERCHSERLRYDIDLNLRQCAAELWNQFQATNCALSDRIRETTDTLKRLKAHLCKTNLEIRNMERAVDLLRCAIQEKEGPMKVAQTRLDERTRRICVEVCYDQPMQGLQTEVYELRQSIATLKEKLRCAELSLCRLQNTRARLDNDIAVKEQSLRIDAKCCLAMRTNMPIDPKCGPVYCTDSQAKASHLFPNADHSPCGEVFTFGRCCNPCAPVFTGSACCN